MNDVAFPMKKAEDVTRSVLNPRPDLRWWKWCAPSGPSRSPRAADWRWSGGLVDLALSRRRSIFQRSYASPMPFGTMRRIAMMIA